MYTRLQDRVGGRILSPQFGGGGGVAELGAQFIWGSESGMDGGASLAGGSQAGGGRGNPITEVRLLAALGSSQSDTPTMKRGGCMVGGPTG